MHALKNNVNNGKNYLDKKENKTKMSLLLLVKSDDLKI